MQEVFTFLNMGGLAENVEVLPIGGDDVTHETVQRWFSEFKGQDAQVRPSSVRMNQRLNPRRGHPTPQWRVRQVRP